jgi:DNA-binding CsgD family transcriptional regulator
MMALRPGLVAPTSEVVVSPSRFLRSAEVHTVVDAIYHKEASFEEWARGITRAIARAVDDCTDARLELLENGVVVLAASTEDVGGVPGERLTLEMALDGGNSARLSVGCRGRSTTTAAERALLTRIRLHLEIALRARMGTGQRCIALDGVTGADRCLWDQLRTGRMGLLALKRGAQGVYLVVDLGVPWAHRRLTEDEESVLRLAAEGRPSKLISYDLGASEGSISRHLGNAAAKLGARSSFEVVMLAARLGFDTRPVVEIAQLTLAEREIVRLLRAGLSNAAIARTRNRSERTIANQVASVLRKTQSRSRRAVGAAVVASGA